MTLSPLLVAGLLLGLLIAIAGLLRPFLGMLVFVVIHFSQPGELIPALDPLRIELVYGALLLTVLVFRKVPRPDRLPLLSDRIILGSLLLVVAGILSVPFAVWQIGAASSVVDVMKLVTVTFLLRLMIDSKTRLRTVLWCMAGVAAWFAASSLYGYMHGEVFGVKYDWGTFDRAEGMNSIVGGPNELAGVLLALLPLLIVLLRTTPSILAKIFLVACSGLSLAAISLTGSRIAVLGLAAVAIYYIFQSKHKLLTFAGCLLIAALIWTNLPVEYQQRYLTLESYAQGGQLDASNELRLEIWKAGWQIFSKYPIVGVGAGQFSNAYGMIYLQGKSGDWMSPHNLFIQIACEVGIVGLAAFGYFFWQIMKAIQFVLRRGREQIGDLNYEVAIACSVMCLGVIVLSLVGHTLYRPYWYLLAGFVAANRNIVAAPTKEQARSKRATSDGSSPDWESVEPSIATRSDTVIGLHRHVPSRRREVPYRAGCYQYNRNHY